MMCHPVVRSFLAHSTPKLILILGQLSVKQDARCGADEAGRTFFTSLKSWSWEVEWNGVKGISDIECNSLALSKVFQSLQTNLSMK